MPGRALGRVANWVVLATAVLAATFGMAGTAAATCGTFAVCTGADTGAGSLRAAIDAVNADGTDSGVSPDTITVSGGPFTITPLSPLPQIQRPVVLDGTGLTIDDSMAPAASPPPALNDALVLQTGSDGSTVNGLDIVGAAGGSGISIVSSHNVITGNAITPLLGAANKFGITVFGSDNTIGGAGASEANLIYNNTGDGIFVVGPNGAGPAVTGNVIEGNTIAGNGNNGVEIAFGATGNTVGGAAVGAGNAIYGNTGAGVLVSGSGSSGNAIAGNRIGTAADGTQLPNGEAGVKFAQTASGNTVTGGSVFAGASTSAIDSGGNANQVSMVSLAGGPMPLITGGLSFGVTAGAATPSGGGVAIPVTVTGATPGATVEVDLLDGACSGSTANLPFLAGTSVTIQANGTGTATITASGDPPLPVFEASDADGPLNMPDPCPPPSTGGTGGGGSGGSGGAGGAGGSAGPHPAPVNTAPPTISRPPDSGQITAGETLTAQPGTWTSNPTFAYQWQSCDPAGTQCFNVLAATKSTYLVTGVDEGHTLRVVVTATAAGVSASVASAATGEVFNPSPAPVEATGPIVVGDGAQAKLLCNEHLSCLAVLLLEVFGASASRSQPAHHQHRLVIGQLNVRIPAHGQRTVKVSLNRAGRRLLAKQGKLKAKFIVTVGGRTVESVPVTFKAKAPKRHKHG